jgi:hypothetical protein
MRSHGKRIFQIFQKSFFFHFAVSFALLSTGIRLARAPKGKGKYPTVKKSAMEKNGWVKSCSFLVWLLEKSRKEEKKRQGILESSGTNLLGQGR